MSSGKAKQTRPDQTRPRRRQRWSCSSRPARPPGPRSLLIHDRTDGCCSAVRKIAALEPSRHVADAATAKNRLREQWRMRHHAPRAHALLCWLAAARMFARSRVCARCHSFSRSMQAPALALCVAARLFASTIILQLSETARSKSPPPLRPDRPRQRRRRARVHVRAGCGLADHCCCRGHHTTARPGFEPPAN